MNFKFKKLNKDVETFIAKEKDDLITHLRECTDNSIEFFKTHINEETMWEKNIPLWIAEHFIKRGNPSYKMNGNYQVSNKMFSHYSKNKKVKKLLLNAAKSKNKNHADFTLFGEGYKRPILIIEIKSQLNNQRSVWQGIFKDLLVVAAHQVGLAENGRALAIYINKDKKGNIRDKEMVKEKMLNKLLKSGIDGSEKEFRSFLDTHFICVF